MPWEQAPALLQVCRDMGDAVKEKVFLEHVLAMEFQMLYSAISQWVSGMRRGD